MSTKYFSCVEHVIPCHYIRHYSSAVTPGHDGDLQLCVKQYTPLSQSPDLPQVTIIGGHANGFEKELYEPLWDELYQCFRKEEKVAIRSIWFADIYNSGASGVINESLLGNDRM